MEAKEVAIRSGIEVLLKMLLETKEERERKYGIDWKTGFDAVLNALYFLADKE